MKNWINIGLASAIVVISYAIPASAQWEKTNGPDCTGNAVLGYCPGMATLNGDIFAATFSGLFRSADTGRTWSLITGPRGVGLTTFGDNLLSYSDDVALSSDYGESWTNYASSDTIFWDNSNDSGLYFHGIELFMHVDNQDLDRGGPLSFLSLRGDLFASYGFGVYRSTDTGKHWSSIDSVAEDYMASSANKLFIHRSDSLFLSTDLGITWNSFKIAGSKVLSVAATNDSFIVAKTNAGTYYSTNDGEGWNASSGLTSLPVLNWTLVKVENLVLLAGYQGYDHTKYYIYRSTNLGTTWSTADSLTGSIFLLNDGNKVFAALQGADLSGMDSGVVESTDSGSHWNYMSLVPLDVHAMVVVGSKIIAGTGDSGAYVTSNDGSSWNRSDSAIGTVLSLLATSNYLFAGTNGAVFRSADTGTTWTSEYSTSNVNALANTSNKLFAGTDNGIYQSTNNGINWSSAFQSVHVNALVTQGSKVFAGTSANGLMVSTNDGSSWSAANGSLPISDVQSLAVKGGILFAGTNGNGLFLSKDTGTSWTDVSSGLPASSISALEVNNAQFFAGTNGGGIYRTDDSGATWKQVDSNLSDPNVTSLAIRNGNLFAGTIGGGVWERPLSQMSVIEPNSVARTSQATLLEIQSYPNPLTESTTISFTPETSGYADVSIVNLLGMEVAHLFSGELAAGNHSFTWDSQAGTPAPLGMYECLVRMNGGVETLPVVLAR